MITDLAHTAFRVHDLEKSLAFTRYWEYKNRFASITTIGL